jgi:hypothetical protein
MMLAMALDGGRFSGSRQPARVWTSSAPDGDLLLGI